MHDSEATALGTRLLDRTSAGGSSFNESPSGGQVIRALRKPDRDSPWVTLRADSESGTAAQEEEGRESP